MTKQAKSESNAAQVRRRNRELSILNTIAQAINREVDLGQTVQTALAQVTDLLDLSTGWIFLMHPETQRPYLAASRNLPPALANSPERLTGTCYCLDSYQAGDMAGAANVSVITCSRLKNLIDGTDGLRYHATIPLYAGGKQMGVLNVASANWRELSNDDLRLLYTVGDLLGIAVERAQLFAQSAEMGAIEERNRLAREIHDTVAQGLAAAALKLETIDALLEAKPELAQLQKLVTDVLNLTQTNLDQVRRSVLDLRATPLEGQTLTEALASLIKEARQSTQLHITFTQHGAEVPLPVRYQLGLYRIVQEALNNIVQHANTLTAEITLLISATQIQLIISDDGCGFDPTQISANRFGLIGINERVKLLSGQFSVESSPGTGTRLAVNIPLGET